MTITDAQRRVLQAVVALKQFHADTAAGKIVDYPQPIWLDRRTGPALIRRGLMVMNEHGNPEITEAGKQALRENE